LRCADRRSHGLSCLFGVASFTAFTNLKAEFEALS